jgi:hypothetical protein
MDFYKNYEHMIDFSAATVENPFGAQFLSLAERNFEDIETAVAALTEGFAELGFEVDEEGVVGLMTGEIQPSEEVVEAISGLTDSEAEIQRLYNAAAASYDLAADLLEAEGDDYEDEDYEDEIEDEEIEDGVIDEDEIEQPRVAVTSSVENPADDSRVDMLYSRQLITDKLNEYIEVADQMMAGGAGLMTPHIKNLLFGQSDKNRYMNFSAACEDFDVDPATYLTCIEFSLNLLAELDGVDSRYFEAQVQEDMSEGINFSSRVDEDAVEGDAREMLKMLNL